MKFASYSIHFTAAGVLTLCGILFFAAPATAEDIENKALTTETNAVPESKAAPEKTDWAQAAHQSTESLLKHFWNSTGRYFNAESLDSTHFNYWPQAHAGIPNTAITSAPGTRGSARKTADATGMFSSMIWSGSPSRS